MCMVGQDGNRTRYPGMQHIAEGHVLPAPFERWSEPNVDPPIGDDESAPSGRATDGGDREASADESVPVSPTPEDADLSGPPQGDPDAPAAPPLGDPEE